MPCEGVLLPSFPWTHITEHRNNIFSLRAQDPEGVAEPETVDDSLATKTLKLVSVWCEIFVSDEEAVPDLPLEASSSQLAVNTGVAVVEDALSAPCPPCPSSGPSSAAPTRPYKWGTCSEPYIHAVHLQVLTLHSIKLDATASTSPFLMVQRAGQSGLPSTHHKLKKNMSHITKMSSQRR